MLRKTFMATVQISAMNDIICTDQLDRAVYIQAYVGAVGLDDLSDGVPAPAEPVSLGNHISPRTHTRATFSAGTIFFPPPLLSATALTRA